MHCTSKRNSDELAAMVWACLSHEGFASCARLASSPTNNMPMNESTVYFEKVTHLKKSALRSPNRRRPARWRGSGHAVTQEAGPFGHI